MDGSLLWPPAHGIQEVFGEHVDCYSYFDLDGEGRSASSILEAVTNLADYVASSGPFDGVIGFSQGAVLAATLIIAVELNCVTTTRMTGMSIVEPLLSRVPPFRCAIFLCGGLPFDVSALQEDTVIQLTPKPEKNALMHLPVVNCWADNDMDYPGMGPPLSQLCAAAHNLEVVHSAGHAVPSEGEDLERLLASVTATLKRALKEE